MKGKRSSILIRKKPLFVLLAMSVAVILVSCDFPLGAKPTPTPTLTNTATSTNTPTYTPTNTPTSTVDKTGTQAAKVATENAEATKAIEDAMAVMAEEFDFVDEEMGTGKVVYADPEPIAVESSGANSFELKDLPDTVQAADFAFHTSLTWEVKQKIGLVNCEIVFRRTKDSQSYYDMSVGRISGAGHIYFTLVVNKKYSASSWTTGLPFISNNINVDNKGENDIFLVVRGSKFVIYTNGSKVGTWFNGKLAEGEFSVGTWQDTGTSVCTYADNWIWEFDKGK